VVGGYSSSKGTLNEIRVAKDSNIPVFFESNPRGVPTPGIAPDKWDNRLIEITIQNIKLGMLI
jgi:hypothetical protein